jgi:hypothetical protein
VVPELGRQLGGGPRHPAARHGESLLGEERGELEGPGVRLLDEVAVGNDVDRQSVERSDRCTHVAVPDGQAQRDREAVALLQGQCDLRRVADDEDGRGSVLQQREPKRQGETEAGILQDGRPTSELGGAERRRDRSHGGIRRGYLLAAEAGRWGRPASPDPPEHPVVDVLEPDALHIAAFVERPRTDDVFGVRK